MSSLWCRVQTSKILCKGECQNQIKGVLGNFNRSKVTHAFRGYKYTGHYTNLKFVDPNLERYSPLILIPKKGFNRFSTIHRIQDSLALKVLVVTTFSLSLTILCFTEKEEWQSYKVANKIFYVSLLIE